MFGIEEFGRLFIMLVGILGNGLVIRVITKDVLMQTFSNKLLLVIAISDIGACVVTMPFSFISMLANRWLFGQMVCDIAAFFCDLFIRVSSLTLTLVVFQKHLIIASKNVMAHTNRSIKKFIIFFCLLACVFSIPNHPKLVVYDNDIFVCKLYHPRGTSTKDAAVLLLFGTMETLCFRIIPYIVLIVSFVNIIKAIGLRREVLKSKRAEPMPMSSKSEHLRIMSDGYTALTTLILALVNVALTLPSVVVNGYFFQTRLGSTNSTFKSGAFLCILINPVLRPLIYGLRHPRCWKYISHYYQRKKRYFMVHGLCLGTTARSTRYVVPQCNILEMKPDAFGSINNGGANQSQERMVSSIRGRLSTIEIASTSQGSSVLFQKSMQSVIMILENEHFAIESVSNRHQSAIRRGNGMIAEESNENARTSYGSEAPMVVEDIDHENIPLR